MPISGLPPHRTLRNVEWLETPLTVRVRPLTEEEIPMLTDNTLHILHWILGQSTNILHRKATPTGFTVFLSATFNLLCLIRSRS